MAQPAPGGAGDGLPRPLTAAAHQSPADTARERHPAWGGDKLRAWLVQQEALPVPSASGITKILRRHGYLERTTPGPHAWRRFEARQPNDAWQLDFKGPVMTPEGRLNPLVVLDDHSRFVVGAWALATQRGETVRACLTAVFRQVGMPWTLLADNGPPWGHSGATVALTTLTAWLTRLGIRVHHGRPYHPQTQGKIERCLRTLGAEALHGFAPADQAALQARLDAWRMVYNHDRIHAALDNQPPITRYRVSPRSFPEVLPELVYPADAWLVRVTSAGYVRLNRRQYYLSEAIAKEVVRIEPLGNGAVVQVWYGPVRVTELQLDHPAT